MLDSPSAIQFVETIINEKGLTDLDEDVRLELRNGLLRRLEDMLNRQIIETLTPVQAARLEHLIDTKHVDKIPEFLHNEEINVQGIVAGVMADFRAAYLKD